MQESCNRFWPEEIAIADYGRHEITLNEVQCEEWDTYNLTVQAAGGTVSTSIVYEYCRRNQMLHTYTTEVLLVIVCMSLIPSLFRHSLQR